MTTGIFHAQPPATDGLLLPGLAMGASLALTRRTIARSRRIPGLSLLFVRPARGLARTAPSHVPALPWGIALLPALSWGWGERGDRTGRFDATGTPARALAGRGVRGAPDPFVRRRLDGDLAGRPRVAGVAPAAGAAAFGSLRPLVHRAFDTTPFPERPASPARPPEDGRDPSRPSSGAVDHRRVDAAPTDASDVFERPGRYDASSSHAAGAPATTGAGQRENAPALLPPVIRRAPRGSWAATWSLAAARPTSVRIERAAGRPAIAGATPALRSESAAGTTAAASTAAAAAHSRALPRTSIGLGAGDADIVGVCPAGGEDRDGQPLEFATGTPLRWAARDAHVVPAAITGVLAIADSLRAHVTKEIQQTRDVVDRVIASRKPEPPPAVSPMPTDDTVRKTLSRMRTLMQEERFRSGQLR